jgi:hypothetical protein
MARERDHSTTARREDQAPRTALNEAPGRLYSVRAEYGTAFPDQKWRANAPGRGGLIPRAMDGMGEIANAERTVR